MNHSPTPFRAETIPVDDPRNPFTEPRRVTVAADGTHVTLDSCDGNDWKFGIHACNCHDELVAALEELTDIAYHRRHLIEGCGHAIDNARAALANARQPPTEKEPRP